MSQQTDPQFTPDDLASWDYAQIWDKFPVPARPSEEELVLLKKEISQIPHENVLILGSTIEYRSLCKSLGISPYVADFEKSNYETLTSYSEEKFDDEKFLETDWLEIETENKYDVIIGHRAINVVGKEMLRTFFEKMHKSLKPGGVFYCKGNVLYEGEVDQLHRKVKKWGFEEERKHPLFSYIEVDLYFHTANEDGYVVYPKARQVANQIFQDGLCSAEDYDLIRLLISMSEEARFRGLIREEELRQLAREVGFTNQEWIVLDKDICSNMPIIKLQK